MGATTYWRALSQKTALEEDATPSSFAEVLARAFGERAPWRLGPEDIGVLRGLSLGTRNASFDELIRLIGDVGHIEVWQEW